MAEATAAQHVEEKVPQNGAAVVQSTKGPLSFMPSSWDDAYRIAGYLAATGLTPDALRGKRDDLLYIIATGQEFGLSPIQAIREIVIIKGKPYLSALLRIGMVKNSPVCEYFRLVSSDATQATFETKRKGEGITKLSYTIEQARQAGVIGRKDAQGNLIQDQWNKDPALMLRRRCGSQLADEVYSDVTRGSRDREELDEEREREVNPAPLRSIGLTSAPPPPEEAQVESAPTKPRRDNMKVVEVPPTQSEAVKAAGGITNSEMDRAGTPPVSTDLTLYEQTCIRLKECSTVDHVDKLMLNLDQTQFNATERDALAKIFKDRRKAMEPKK